MSFILILIFIFFIWPLIRVFWTIHKVRSKARKAYEQMYGDAFGSQQQSQQSRKPGWTRPQQKPKRIDPSVGEFVSYEEVAVETRVESDSQTERTEYRREAQITDAEWEDVK